MSIELPEILNIPPKLLPLIQDINDYRYFLLEGGRGSGKTQAVARWILYLADKKKLRIFCGRETQNTIEESVHTALADLITKYNLFFEVQKAKITSKRTGSEIKFKGFREQGTVNIKGLEGADILWIEEAQAITKNTLDVIIPTIRKNNAKIFFTMNRFVRTDPVYEQMASRENCKHIKINYYDNPFCPDALKAEAGECQERSPKDYKHIWLGEPLETTEEYLFNFSKLSKMNELQPFGELVYPQSAMGVDFAGGGGDLCVASRLIRRSNVHWEIADQRAWTDPDTDLSVGKTIALYGNWQPDVFIVDKGGLGYPMFISISKSISKVIGFDGAQTELCTENAGNHRAEGYLNLKSFVDKEWLISRSRFTNKQLETIKKKYKANGRIYIQSKKDLRKEGFESPDRADSVMMAVFAIVKFLGKQDFRLREETQTIQRVNRRKVPR